MRVYHIVKDELEFAVGSILYPRSYNLDDFKSKKHEVEEALENVRSNYYPNYPSRLNCLFVCRNLNDVESWSLMKSDIYGRHFKILTLEVTTPVHWFSAQSYNEYFCDIRNDLNQACKEYWQSHTDTNIDEMEECEGIITTPVQIVAVQHASICRDIGLKIID